MCTQARGFRVFTVPLARTDWLRVARGLLTLGFWRGSLTTHPGYTWWVAPGSNPAGRGCGVFGFAAGVHLVCAVW